MENTIKGEEVKNEETIIEEVTEQKEEQKFLEVNGTSIAAIAVAGAIKPLAHKGTYLAGAGVGLLFGKKTGVKAVGTYLGVNALYNVARFVMGDMKVKSK